MPDQLCLPDKPLAARLHVRHDEVLARRLLAAIKEHRGRKAAVTSEYLAALMGSHDRDIRLTIKQLIEEQGALIGSATSKPAGFYWITSQAELDVVKKGLRARGLSCFVRLAKLDNTSLESLLGQTAMELTQEGTRHVASGYGE